MTANAGYHAYTTGDVLTAAQVQYNLQNQTVMYFATSAARTTALTGVIVEGMVTYIPANGLEYYNGSAWVVLSTGGDITGVTAGTGISGGGASGTVTVTNDMATTITTKGDLVPGTGSGTYARLAVGTNGQILVADSTASTGLAYKGVGVANGLTTTGDTIYSSSGTTQSRLGIGSTGQVLTVASGVPSWATPSGSTYVGASLYKTAVQSMNNGADVTVTWDGENFNTNAIHNNTTNNSRLTIPTGYGGKWLVNYSQSWAAASTGAKWGYIYKNGLTDIFGTYWTYTSAGSQVKQSASCVLSLSAGDYLTVVVGQNSGGALNLAADYATSIMITYLGA